MNHTYLKIELVFEKLTKTAMKVLGNSITFIIAFVLVLFWWSLHLFSVQNLLQNIGDFILGITFLSLFIIQKSFNRYSALVHLKMNELISSHESAHNSVMNTADKTEHEIRALSEEYYSEADQLETLIEDAEKPL